MLSAILCVILLISSCYTQDKATRQVYRAHLKYPIVGARFCANVYPTRESIQYIKGKDSLIYSFVTVDCDSAFEAAIEEMKRNADTGKMKPIIITKPCPPSLNRVDTLIKTEVDSAAITLLTLVADSLRSQIVKKDTKIQDQSDKIASKNKIILWETIGLIILAAIIAFIFYKRLK